MPRPFWRAAVWASQLRWGAVREASRAVGAVLGATRIKGMEVKNVSYDALPHKDSAATLEGCEQKGRGFSRQVNQVNMLRKAEMRCGVCPIRDRAVCARCDEDEMVLLEQMKHYRSYEPGQRILWYGDELAFVASVVEGVATLSKTLTDGRTQMVGLLLPSDFIGRPGRTAISFDVVAATDVTLCCFEREPFERLMANTPHLAQRMVEIAMDELDAAREWMLLLGRKSARERLASFLYMFVRRQSEGDMGVLPPHEMALPLTREEIANYIGLTFETVSRQISALKAQGVIAFSDRRHFRVLDAQALRAATGDQGEPLI